MPKELKWKVCVDATINGPMDHIHGGDQRFGVMREGEFTENEDSVNVPSGHPLKR